MSGTATSQTARININRIRRSGGRGNRSSIARHTSALSSRSTDNEPLALGARIVKAVLAVHTRSLDEADRRSYLRSPFNRLGEHQVAKTIGKRKEYTKDDLKLLKTHSKARTPVAKLSKLMKRSEGSLRQKARAMGIGLGHQR